MNRADYHNIPQLPSDFSSRVMMSIEQENIKREKNRSILYNVLCVAIVGSILTLSVCLLHYFGFLLVEDMVQMLKNNILFVFDVLSKAFLTLTPSSLTIILSVALLLGVHNLGQVVLKNQKSNTTLP